MSQAAPSMVQDAGRTSSRDRLLVARKPTVTLRPGGRLSPRSVMVSPEVLSSAPTAPWARTPASGSWVTTSRQDRAALPVLVITTPTVKVERRPSTTTYRAVKDGAAEGERDGVRDGDGGRVRDGDGEADGEGESDGEGEGEAAGDGTSDADGEETGMYISGRDGDRRLAMAANTPATPMQSRTTAMTSGYRLRDSRATNDS